MIIWLDHKIFGNGRGLASPHCDDRYFWLSGRIYTFMSGFGAQLHNLQWQHPKAGEERLLFGYRFRPLHSERCFLWLWRDSRFPIPTPICRVRVAWSRVDLPRGINEANAALREMKSQVGDYMRTSLAEAA